MSSLDSAILTPSQEQPSFGFLDQATNTFYAF